MKRIRPGRDEKILVSWNALMIKGMAHAGMKLGEPQWIASAQRAVDFIVSAMWKNERLLATSKDRKAHLNAYLDDYAFLLDALLVLLQVQFRRSDLTLACALADVLLAQFEDQREGGFFFTSHDHEKLIHRPKGGQDNAMPSGNGIAAFALQRLGHIVGDARYIEAAERTLRLFYPLLERQPDGLASLLIALQEYHAPPQIVILRSAPGASAACREKLAREYWPATLIITLEGEVSGLPDTLMKPFSQDISGWVCQGHTCLPPIDDCAQLIEVCHSGEVARSRTTSEKNR